MASIRQFRKKIKSAKNIAKLTRAMQLVAASKMKRAQEAASRGKDYTNGMIDLSFLLSNYLDPSLHPLLQTLNTDQAKDLIVLIAPEKGLCGSLVTNLSKKVLVVTEGARDVEFVAIGRKADRIVQKLGGEIIAQFQLGLSLPKYEIVPPIARVVEERFLARLSRKVTFVYSEFVNTMTQVPVEKVLLPLTLVRNEEIDAISQKNYLFEPSPKTIVDSFLGIYLEVQIYQILLEAYASEQSARMIAMKNATDNATGLIDQLSLEYNKLRQAAITNEILDIGNAVGMLTAV